jgi:hypothetical protein
MSGRSGIAALILVGTVGCATATRTPQQWHDEVEAGIRPRVPALRSCYQQGLQAGYVPRGVPVTINVLLVTFNEQRTYSYFYYSNRDRAVAPSSIDSPRFEKCISDVLGPVGIHPVEDYFGRGYWSFVFDPNMPVGEQVAAHPAVGGK